MVDTLAQRAQLPKPRVYLIDSDMPNAFATGRSPSKGAVAVTSGIMRMLDRDELAGVIAHELAHIKNRDTLISSVAATVAGAIAMLADIVMWGFIFGGFGGSDEEEGGGIGELVGGFLTLILAPIGALLIQMAISVRVNIADADGAKILGNPLPLASALEKLEATVRQGVAEGKACDFASLHCESAGGLGGLFPIHRRRNGLRRSVPWRNGSRNWRRARRCRLIEKSIKHHTKVGCASGDAQHQLVQLYNERQPTTFSESRPDFTRRAI
ncbi:MAG: M48 family metalloprotease [Caldilineaceae bacterium]